MTRALRVVHLPARTPYVRKIVSPDFIVLNRASTDRGTVPNDVTADWLLDRRPWDWLDVLHLHHIEFEDPAALQRLLDACIDSSVKVVFTAHDVAPMAGTAEEYRTQLRLVVQAGASWIGLTDASVRALRDMLPDLPPVTVIPHGYVASPDSLTGRSRGGDGCGPEYLLYGALRPNRDHLSTIANWILSVTDPMARLHLLLRGLSPVDFQRYDVPALLALVRSEPRVQVSMRGYHSDDEIVAAGLSADALLMPYLSGSHSGQLELAFDLNLLPVCSSVGYLADQYRVHKGLVPEPIWFDWAEGHPFLFGERFVAALDTAQRQLRHGGRRRLDGAFLDHRREEHRRFLDAHRAVYAA